LSAENEKNERELAEVKAMAETKRQKLGVKYARFVSRVVEVLRANDPAFVTMSDDQMSELVMLVDVIGEESRGTMKKLGEYCTGCGWCCSQTTKIVVTKEDAERISRALKQKIEALFKYDGKEWTIKQAHPCPWWNAKNGRCAIYNLRPQVCRTWPMAVNEIGQKMVHSVAECSYAVMVLASKVMRYLRNPA
jgi:Fe-S-cluster containining protein